MWVDELRSDVVAQASIEALIGAEPNARCWPNRLRQRAEVPALVYQVISRPFNEYTHDGDSGLRSPRVQWSSWSKTYDDAWQLAQALTALYSGVTLVLADHEYACVMIVDERDDQDQETGLSRVIVDMLLRQKESA